MLTNLGYLYNVTTTSINKLIHELKINFHRFSTREWIKCILKKKMRESTLSDPFEILRTIVDAYQTMALSSIKISTVLQFFFCFFKILNTEVGYILNIYIYIKMSFPSNLFLFKCNIIIIYNNMILNVHDEIFWMEARQSDCLWKGHAEKKRRRGLAYQKKAWSIDLYDESFNFFMLNVIIGQLTNNWFVSGQFTYTCMIYTYERLSDNECNFYDC